MNQSNLSFPETRDLKQYLLLRNEKIASVSYFDGANYRAIFPKSETLGSYMCKAVLVHDNSGKPRSVSYSPGVDVSSLRPAEYIPVGLIDGLEKAAQVFYEKGFSSSSGVNPYEKDLIQGFRLPDPSLEPDSYWLYGPTHSPKLLVLWGVERERGSSLPICSHSGQAAGRTVVDILREKAAPWNVRMTAIRSYLQDKGLKITSFIADGTPGPVEGFSAITSSAGSRLKIDEVKPLKVLPRWGAYTAFRSAVDEYRTFVENEIAECGSNDIDRRIKEELFYSLKLPDPLAESSSAYYLYQGELLVVLSGEEDESECLALDNTPALCDPASDTASKPTVLENLETLKPTMIKPILMACAGLVVLLSLAFGVLMLIDSRPPSIVEKHQGYPEGLNAPDYFSIKFSEDIQAADGELIRVTVFSMERGKLDKQLEVLEVKQDSDAEDELLVYLAETLVHDSDYLARVSGIVDKSGNGLDQDMNEFEFTFEDEVKPILELTSAHGDSNSWLLRFSEEMDGSFADTSSYKVDGMEIESVDMFDKRSVLLRAKEPFANNSEYFIRIEDDVEDINKNGVAIPEAGYFKEAYVDTVAPTLDTILANTSQTQLLIRFSERIKESSLVEVLNYNIKNSEGEEVTISEASSTLGGRAVILRTTPMTSDTKYLLSMENLVDLGGLALQISDKTEFVYDGPVDIKPPRPGEFSNGQSIYADVGNIVHLSIQDRNSIDTENLSKTETYLLRGGGSAVVEDVENIKTAESDGWQTALISLKIGGSFTTEPSQYTLVVTKVEDVLGNRVDNLSFEFTSLGSGLISNDIVVESARYDQSSRTIEISFVDELTSGTLGNASNYRLVNDTATVESVEVDTDDSTKVTIRLSGEPTGNRIVRCSGLRLEYDSDMPQADVLVNF